MSPCLSHILSGSSRGSRTPYWGLEQSPSWMPASSRKGKSSGGDGPVGPWHRDGHRVRSANQTSRLEETNLHILGLIFLLNQESDRLVVKVLSNRSERNANASLLCCVLDDPPCCTPTDFVYRKIDDSSSCQSWQGVCTTSK